MMETIKDFRNELFNRRELVVVVESEKNPIFDEVRKTIAEKIGKPEENIDVRRVEGRFGLKKFSVEANVYDSKEDLKDMKKLEMTRKQRKEKEDGEKSDKSSVKETKKKILENSEEKNS